jgi:glycosyltransferase involved in cell wall biosynthesis
MKEAFEQLGYKVDFVEGYGSKRKKQIKRIMDNMKNGEIYQFVYAECSTDPTLLTEKHHLPTYPFLDFRFFAFCRKYNLKIGLFYRDVYWNFPFYGATIPFWKRAIAKFFYRYDLRQYKKYLSVLYLPSIQMFSYIPCAIKTKVVALPPGADVIALRESEGGGKSTLPKEGFNVLYVGGIGGLYNIKVLLRAVAQRPNVKLTICCRLEEWKAVMIEYEALLQANIHVIHKSGKELVPYYNNAHLVSLFVEPSEYRNFAFPVKLFEYIRFGKPIIATSQTAVGDFVKKNEIGWVINHEETFLLELFDQLSGSPELFDDKKKNIRNILEKNTWVTRATQVVNDLEG